MDKYFEEYLSDWPTVSFREICIVQGGFAFKSNSYVNDESGIPIIKIGDLQNGRVMITEKTSRVPRKFSTEKSLRSYLLNDGDVLIALTGATTGKIGYYQKNNTSELAFLNQRVGRFSPVPGKAILKFIEFLGLTDSFQIGIKENILVAAQGNVSPKKIESLEVTIPPIPEQRRIAAVLSLVQRAIEQQERLIALTTELKKSLMHKLFTEGTRGEPQKQTEIGLIPESWEVVKLKDTVEYIDYGLSKAIPKTRPPNGVKIVSTADITRDGELLYRKIRMSDAPAKTVVRLMLKDGDVLFNWRNSAELIGKTTIYDEQPEPHIFASFILRLRCDEVKSHNFYLKHLMNHWRERGVFIKLARRAVNQANYNKNEISVLKIPQPHYDEQVEIAETIRVVEDRIGSLSDTKEGLQHLFRTLLHQLMTAEIRVNDLDLEELGLDSEK